MEYEDSDQKEEREFSEELGEMVRDTMQKSIMGGMIFRMLEIIVVSNVAAIREQMSLEKAEESINDWLGQLEKVLLPMTLEDVEESARRVWEIHPPEGKTLEGAIQEKREMVGGLFHEALGDLRGMLREGLKKDEEKT